MKRSFWLFTLLLSLVAGAQEPLNRPLKVTVNSMAPPSEAQWQTSRKQIAELSRHINANPQQAELYARRGSAYYFAHMDTAAISDFNKAISLGLQRPDYFVLRGLSKLRSGKHYALPACQDFKTAREMGDTTLDAEFFKKQCPDF